MKAWAIKSNKGYLGRNGHYSLLIDASFWKTKNEVNTAIMAGPPTVKEWPVKIEIKEVK